MELKTRPVVRCQICYCECSSVGARFHKNETGHNCWELLLPVEKKVVEDTPTPYLSRLPNRQGKEIGRGQENPSGKERSNG